MRVPEVIKDCVVFLGRTRAIDKQLHEVELTGTGFLVGQPSEFDQQSRFLYLVTAKHVIDGLQGDLCGVRINTVDGGSELLSPGPKWWFHPNDPTVDIAVVPFGLSRETFAFTSIPTESFATPQNIAEADIGAGDEVFMTGLFSFKHGDRRNLPIVRYGNIAALAGDELIASRDYNMRAHLIEARSLGGLSGSPAFVRQTISIGFGDPKHFSENELYKRITPANLPPEEAKMFITGIGPFFLLGLTHGHWDIPISQKNEVTIIEDAAGKVNMGIALVVPAEYILDVINQPELAAMRKEVHDHSRRQVLKPTLDNVVSKNAANEQMTPKGTRIAVPTRDSFISDLEKATRRKKPSE